MMHSKYLVMLVFSTFLFVGCSNGQLSVKGTVTLDGSPIEGGSISLVPVGSGPTGGGLIANGAFQFRSLPGEFTVRVYGEKATGNFLVSEENPDIKNPERVVVTDPATHWNNSTVCVTVEKGMRPMNIELKSPDVGK